MSQTDPPVDTLAVLSAGLMTFCGLEIGGQVWCWGGVNPETGSDAYQANPVVDQTYEGIAAGYGGIHGVLPGGEVETWGSGGWRAEVGEGELVESLDVGGVVGCGVTSSERLICWSSPEVPEFGLEAVPSEQAKAAAAGSSHACLLDGEGVVHCWGQGTSGETAPQTGAFRDVSCGDRSTCGVRDDGSLSCWGLDSGLDGELNDTYGIFDVPEGEFESLEISWSNACAQRPDGSLECWGSDEFGQLTGAREAFAEWWPDR